ncbi:transcription factor S-II, central domain-containing protein [Tricharina praecox]|uniref:transcription factor S-II, central domain-containing protein n=1 Tax=Tricharina praecox TaxID=43433 RepID=UPI00221F38B0|nr:transcription factor S-II, central domain-containing protein [Tricharina praecox]KAI5846900.1 transcription factor S-II, central domain-containing protein [Tricharina praecox]
MDAKEVMTHVTNIDTAVKEKLPAAHIADLLKSLKTGVVATEKLLRETRVGMAVNKLRTHADKTVSDLAKEIVGKWKQDVHQKAKQDVHKKVNPRPQEKSRSTASPTITSPKPKPKNMLVKVDPSKRTKATDGVDYNVTGDKARDNCIGILYDGLCVGSDAPSDHILSLAKSLEAEVFVNHKKKIEVQYKRRIQMLFLSLKDKKNPSLRTRVVKGEISPARLSTMESHEMASDERKAEDQEIQKENTRKAMVAKPEKSISDQLQCGKCGQKKVSYTQAQTRSADEPMTTFCTCENCGNLWKFS